MVLIEDVKDILDRLAPHGWAELLSKHGLDITKDNLADLAKELSDDEKLDIKREVSGFEDFSKEGVRAIEPGDPSRSLLFHALASPNVVTKVDGTELGAFPTPKDIETIENYVYGVNPPKLKKLEEKGNLAIVVFATEYRPSSETIHKQHADMCFSRTGIARVGTKKAEYVHRNRGFSPFVEGDDENTIRVLPAKYSVYLAVKQEGKKNSFDIMRFENARDNDKDFWVPIHKLFNGNECIDGINNLSVDLDTIHTNEKIRRIHIQRGEVNVSKKPPFIFHDGIAELSTNLEFGTGMLEPTVHNGLVEEAKDENNNFVTFTIQPKSNLFFTSLIIQSDNDARHAPEYVNVRHRIDDNGAIENFNFEDKFIDNGIEISDVKKKIQQGDYRALHYVDFTGDGAIKANCPQLSNRIKSIPAYSLVTAPDFFPYCDQGELMNWWQREDLSNDIREWIWAPTIEGGRGTVIPETLCDDRFSPNIEIKMDDEKVFGEDETITAIVSLLNKRLGSRGSLKTHKRKRHSWLPDSAAGVFAPGWDVSKDKSDGITHFAAYGLGSPFPEDAKLCAALSTFWPAAAPDAARTFRPNKRWPTVCPLTDEEIGIIGNSAWDAISGPKKTNDDENKKVVEYNRTDYADYVDTSINNKFSIALTSKIDFEEYTNRIHGMVRTYKTLKELFDLEPVDRGNWAVNSFRKISQDDDDVKNAQNDTHIQINPGDITYRFEVYEHGNGKISTNNHRKWWEKIENEITILTGSKDSTGVFFKQGSDKWESRNV